MPPLSIDADREIAAAALLLATLSVGATRLSSAADIVATDDLQPLLACLAALGAGIDYHVEADGAWSCDVVGRGLGGLSEPSGPLAIDGSPASMIAAVLATNYGRGIVTSGLSADLLILLGRIGADIRAFRLAAASDGLVDGPFWICGALRPLPPDQPFDIAPALVPAVLLAALNVSGRTALISPGAARWLPLFAAFGADIAAEGRDRVRVIGERELVPASVRLGY